MIKESLSVLMFLVASMVSYGQVQMSSNDSANDFADELIRNGVDTLCVYEKFDPEEPMTPSVFVLWRESGKDRIRKMGQKRNKDIAPEKASQFWNLALPNLEAISAEKVQSFAYSENGEIVDSPVDSDDYGQFSMYCNGRTAEFWSTTYAFQETGTVGDRTVKNVHFESNGSLIGKAVLDKLVQITAAGD